MTRARALVAAVPQQVWAAVIGLALLGSLGVAVVVGVGLSTWRGAVGAAPGDNPAIVERPPSSGVVVVPSRAGAAPAHRAPAKPPLVRIGPGIVTTVAAPPAPVTPPAVAPVTVTPAPVAPAPTVGAPRLTIVVGHGHGHAYGRVAKALGLKDAAPLAKSTDSTTTAAPRPAVVRAARPTGHGHGHRDGHVRVHGHGHSRGHAHRHGR